jgi:hypothetical protein
MQNSLNDGIELSKTDAIFRIMTNNSSTTLPHGTVVVLDTTDSTGSSVTVPSAEGVPAFGVIVHPQGKGYSYADQADVVVCVNVNGTDNIAAGNILKVYDTNGIGYLAVPGTDHISTCFGTALEAYTDNDSDGHINVYVGKR